MRDRRPPYRSLALCVAGAVVVGISFWIGSVTERSREAQEHLLAARAALSTGSALGLLEGGSTSASQDTTAALTQVGDACVEAGRADGLLRDVSDQLQAIMPLVQTLQSVPVVGQRARAQTAALEAGTQLAAAGTVLCQATQPFVVALGDSDNDPRSGQRGSASASFQTILAARPQLSLAANRLDQALQALADVADDDLDPSARSGTGALRARLPGLIQTLRDTTTLLDLLGASGEHRFLLVSQNPDELRATGGYIGSAGVVSVANGSVRLLEYGSSRAYDTPPTERVPTPPPFNRYMGDYWNLAGANWWASYPDVARQLAYFFTLVRAETPFDGVVALDQFGLQRLLEALGPVDVPEYSERVGAADVQSALDRHVHAGDGNDEVKRKGFTAALSGAVLQQVLKAPKPLVPALVRAVQTALDQQHLLVAVWDPSGAAVLARRHWDGSLLPASQDALMVVDTDVVSSKQSQAIARRVRYEVDLGNAGGPAAHTKITYTNFSRPQPDVQYVENYSTFVRVYAPSGATLLSSQGFSSGVSEQLECGRSVFGGEVLIPSAATVEVGLSYALPPSVSRLDDYEVLVQQQPGVPPGSVSVLVNRPNGRAVGVVAENSPGVSYRWQLSAADHAQFQAAPLPEARPGGCDMPLVAAVPIAAPAWLEIPAASISAAIVELAVQPDGSMDAPPSPEVVGWYRMSARAGQLGNSVLAGHVDWGKNTAVFWGLRNLVSEDAILLSGADGVQHRYSVEWNRVFSRSDASASQLVGGSNDAILTLVTCEGIYDRSAHDYSDRRIIRAALSD